ncbi:MAG TPA: ABC transporter ATP-binding protein, partial [Candidatus Paceibacterota bacterium]|nr:ABC transporter ATP-binding protein [Candidatus Paceibacterota bacterium]
MKRVLTVYWQYTKGIRTSAFLTILLFTAALLFREILRPYVLRDLVDGLTTHANDRDFIWHQVVLFAVMHIAAQICFRSGEFINSLFESNHMRNLRNLAFEHMTKHSLAFFANNHAGALVTRQKRFVNSAEVLFEELVGSTLSMTVQVIGVSIVMLFVSPPMVIGVLVWVGCYILNAIFMGRKRLALDYNEAEQESRVTGDFADVMGNISILKTFGTTKREKNFFSGTVNKHYSALQRALHFANTQNAMQGIFSSIIHIGGIIAAVSLWFNNQMSTGNVILITIYAGSLSSSLWDFGKTIRKFSRAIADAEEMVEIIDTPPSIVDAPGALERISLSPEQATIDFKNVSFAYNSSAQIFNNFNLSIPAGQKVAIIGSTGAGKTTLVSLLLRVIDVQKGSIHIGPYNIKTDVTQDGFKSCISSVSQNIDLYNRSIKDNIGYGNPNATLDEIRAAAKKAFID